MQRILVIDDATQVHEWFAEFFQPPEWWLQNTLTAAAGVAAFTEARPDVVILDVRLPDGSGLDVFRELRAIDATVPVIFITASGSSDLAIEAMKRGAFDYLVKPLD